MKKLFFICGESSGDMHAASLLEELYKLVTSGNLTVKAVGGSYLEKAGARIFFNCKSLGSMGLTEVLKQIPMYLNLERQLLFELQIFKPDVLVLVDFPGFNLRICQKVKKLLPDTKIVYYMPPQVWAWNQGRTKILAKNCDLVLCGLPFEEEFHRKRGVNAYYIGSPIIHEIENYDREKIREELGIKKEDFLIGLFPGSRKSEIHYMLSVLMEAADILLKVFPQYRFMIAQASTISDLDKSVKKFLEGKLSRDIEKKVTILPPGNNHKLQCASDLVWLTSGTVTLESALYETPMILGYRGNPVNYMLYLMLKKVDMIGLPNIICNEKLVPELIQNDAKAESYYQITKEWLHVPGKLDKIKNSLKKVREKLTEKNASIEAAKKVKELLFEKQGWTF